MKKLLMALFLFLPLTAFSADSSTPSAMAGAFLTSIQNGDVSGAYDQLFRGSQIPQEKPEAVATMKMQTKDGLPKFGKILGNELVKEEKFGASVVRLVYILKSEKGPTIWQFYYYKPADSWFLADIAFNDHLAFLQ